jgi:hypothetical protein
VSTVWREPAEATEDYPGLHVHDGTVSGSIRCGGRLPLWAFAYTAVTRGWDAVEAGWSPTEHYGFDAEDLGRFLSDLLEVRGEFGRLLCVLADVERIEGERADDGADGHFAAVHPAGQVCECGPMAWERSWWQQDDLRGRVADQLRRCLAVLEVAQ